MLSNETPGYCLNPSVFWMNNTFIFLQESFLEQNGK